MLYAQMLTKGLPEACSLRDVKLIVNPEVINTFLSRECRGSHGDRSRLAVRGNRKGISKLGGGIVGHVSVSDSSKIYRGGQVTAEITGSLRRSYGAENSLAWRINKT